ncbi:hypothetical protein CY34DRAFT_811909 [Suillus luteus UH-Slu-Lm8-n1]|uniref:Uncharacterized protein n=1 Tax=Suillus luteus UH-Slu-Lm8-n1 TaxID=930992 RepID=A0A0D0A1V1_9AGAM|nr:hypothetical protein CY34DRAFT_811909 [Suillus luteus UH-Slu-Lm8-n1]
MSGPIQPRKFSSSRNPQSGVANASENSGKARWFLEKVKKTPAKVSIDHTQHLRESCSREPVLPNINCEGASSTDSPLRCGTMC